MGSILTSIKKLLGITETDTSFDTDIMIHINTVIGTLYQLGLKTCKSFSISDSSSEWDEIVPEGTNFELVKTYVYLKVRMLFDPPTSSSVTEAFNKNISELEWRVITMLETKEFSDGLEGY